MLPLMTEELDKAKVFNDYALGTFYKEVFERANSELTFAINPKEVGKVVHAMFENLGQPGFYKINYLDNRQITTFGQSLQYSFTKKILEIVRQQGTTHQAYCDNKIIFNDSQHLMYLIDTEDLEEEHAIHLNNLMIDFSQEINNWMNGHIYKSND